MGEPTTHYQISLTARQAVGAFAGLLVALGLAFFFGLMAGYAGRDRAGSSREAASSELSRSASVPDAPPPVETGVAPRDAAKAELAAATTPAPAEPTAPATLHPFEDAPEDEGAGATPGSRTTIAGAPAEAVPPKAPKATAAPHAATAASADRVWVQAASLSSRDEANALGARLSRHGFHAVVLAGSGPKGKIYRVRVGPYRSEDEASHAVTKLRQEKIREPWIVPDGK
ncbi:MAG TPA: SPOR domain-containing protein [Thermoanaerobaculia bacterium]|nr:SPOR domain-containing protein [Thermoanaerobaculia bacterium]